MLYLKAILSVIGGVFRWLGDRQLMNAGEAKSDARHSNETLKAVADAHRPVSDDERDIVRKKYQRD